MSREVAELVSKFDRRGGASWNSNAAKAASVAVAPKRFPRLATGYLPIILAVAGLGCGAARSNSVAPAIPVSPNSHICVQLDMDPALDPFIASLQAERILDTDLLGRVAQAYQQNGGSDAMPKPNDESRVQPYIADDGRVNPYCQKPKTDVLVRLNYSLNANGKPYVVAYGVSRGSVSRSGKYVVDLAGEISAGRVDGMAQGRGIPEILSEDIDRKAEIIRKILQVCK